MRNVLVLVIVAFLAACGEERQVMRQIGVIRTSSASPVIAEMTFVDSGRWTIFEFVDRSSHSTWPLPFHAEISSSDGKVVIEREVTDGPDSTGPGGVRRLTWRVDTLSEPFEGNFDSNGLMPIDHALRDGQSHTLRLRVPPFAEAEYEVYLLENRRVYPWEAVN
ncbi:MAG: hypothetical protein M3P06_10520 [Acidobacteriota bacterium]|nr:hypothetical protein [Acidobacteriota bacterium]